MATRTPSPAHYRREATRTPTIEPRPRSTGHHPNVPIGGQHTMSNPVYLIAATINKLFRDAWGVPLIPFRGDGRRWGK